MSLFTQSSAHLLVDVAGWIPATSDYTPMTPTRLVDTRYGTGAAKARVPAGGSVQVQITGAGGVPSTMVTAAELTVTAVTPSKAGYVSVYPAGATRPLSSTVNYVTGSNRANSATVKIGAGGKVTIFSSQSIDLAIDVTGYWTAVSVPAGPAVTTSALPSAVQGAPYQAQFAATGGVAPYQWAFTGLPAGLSGAADTGVISGTPSATGTSSITAKVTDANGVTGTRTLSLGTPTSLPAACRGTACSITDAGVNTIQLTAAQQVGVTRDSSGRIATVTTTGVTVHVHDVLVSPATTATPSGAISIVTGVAAGTGGTTVSTVTPGTPAQAFDSGTVQTGGAPGHAASSEAAKTYIGGKLVPNGRAVPAVGKLKCTGSATATAVDLSITPNLTPELTAVWKHPLIQIGNVYAGAGGLDMAYAALDGSITAAFTSSITAKGSCTLTFPKITKTVSAGYLGVLIFTVTPKLKLDANAAVAVSTSATWGCSSSYYWNSAGSAAGTRTNYCKVTKTPLELTNAEGSVTLTGTLDPQVTLDEIVGLTGTLTASLTATDQPTKIPIAFLDGQVDGQLDACLACLWKDAPSVTIVSGTIWKQRLWSLGTQPPTPTDPLTITTTSLPAGTAGAAYSATLSATGGKPPYTWTVTGLPAGLSMNSSTGAITGTPTTAGSSSVKVAVKDSAGTTAASTLSLKISPKSTIVAWKQISAGYEHTCAVTTAGAAYCWGSNSEGQLGNGTTTDSATPIPVTGLGTGVASITVGMYHTCAITIVGAAYCWGYNSYGNLGNGTMTDSATPTPVTGLGSGVRSISSGWYHTCAVTASGAAYCWGMDTAGDLGIGADVTYSATPVGVIGLGSGVASISAGAVYTCAVTTTGAAYCWGSNGLGQLGNGAAGAGTISATPVPVTGFSKGAASISAGETHTCAVTTDGAAYCWGYNSDGQLGNGTTTNSATPVPLPVTGFSKGVASISAGETHTCAVTTDGAAYCWGYNGHGELGNGTTTNSPVPVAVLPPKP